MVDATELKRMSESEFRQRLRMWLEEFYPQEWRKPLVFRLRGESEKQWYAMLHEHGWRLPGWPREYGGMGLSTEKQLAYHDEMNRFGVARYIDFGGNLFGPTLIKFGTEEQKARYLPPIVRGEDLWCQGYSEPNAGSDLASLKTTAKPDGDGYLLNGTKIWTTMAAEADRMFLLARTSQEERKQQGISFLILDMQAPGVSVRPILNLSGEDEFNQVFFDDVRIPADQLVGEEGAGWTVAKALLGVERISTSSPASSRDAFAIFEQLVVDRGLLDDPEVRVLYASLLCDMNDYAAFHARVSDLFVKGRALPEQLSLLKITGSELLKRMSDALLTIVDDAGGNMHGVPLGEGEVELRKIFMIARAGSIYGGANDVQRDIVSRAMLGKA